MPIVPLRDLGKAGIYTDIDPFDLPSNAFSFGKNVRFENGRAERGCVFRTLDDLPYNLQGLLSYTDNKESDHLLLVAASGNLYEWSPASLIERTPAGWSPNPSTDPVSIACANNLVLVNRPDHAPWYRSMGGTGSFAQLPSGTGQWGTDWRARSIRAAAGFFVALNVTKGSSFRPNNVMWSNIVQYGVAPDWDIGNASSSAGENTLADMQGPIVDGLALKSRLMIYGLLETWYMEYIGGNAVFRFERQFDKGTINVNCAVEAAGIHYVFGPQDIWMHDGVQDKSLAHGRVRRFIYAGLRREEQSQCFVVHNHALNEVIFCYVSDDAYIKFPPTSGKGCNRGAVYNYAADTWSFVDLPYVSCATRGIPRTGVSFNAVPSTFAKTGGSFASLQGQPKLALLMGGYADDPTGLTSRLRTFATIHDPTTPLVLDEAASAPAFLYRRGLDLDELNAELRGYKLVSSIYPQCRLDTKADPLVFTLGSGDHPIEPPVWGNPQTYDASWYKLDHNVAGRFLYYKIEQTDCQQFALTGLDIDLTLLGSR